MPPEAIAADHYVVSADGKYDNPDVATLEMIAAARRGDDFAIHLTCATDDFNAPKIGRAVEKFFAAKKKAGRKLKVIARATDQRSIQLPLA
jgi:hypothetical protein